MRGKDNAEKIKKEKHNRLLLKYGGGSGSFVRNE